MSRVLPSGMVTFVITDVEGSTNVFRRIGDRYPPLLERHCELLREVWLAHGGHEMATDGDSFFVVFTTATDAIMACAQAQRALGEEPWPDDGVIRVRMGVHTGLAAPRDHGYVAFAAHQAARVADAANGGQVVVSAAAAGRAVTPTGVVMASLGRFRVRDFDEPVELFELEIEGVPPVNAAVRALPAERHNLLQPLTALVGRERDMELLSALVHDHRLVSVVGTGGLGKTRLVIEYGLAHAADWQHGVWFADLSRIDDPTGIATVVAEAVGAPLGHDRHVWDMVIEHLRDREAVVLLDNCEHLCEDVARRAAHLLSACPGMQVITTSREPLGLRGERVWRPAPLETRAGVELFNRLAGITDADPATRDAVQTLCERVDCLPLAIELAAARADEIPPTALVAELDEGVGLGTSRDPTLSTRQRSLEELIAWSYELLTADEQHLFRHLAVFETGFDLEAASATVLGHATTSSVIGDLMRSLLEKSLIVADPTTGATRHRMQVTIRSYARHLLDAAHEHTACAARLARHYLSSFGPQFDGNDTARRVYRRRITEVDNLRHVISAIEADDQPMATALAVVVVDTIKLSSRRHGLTVGLALLDQLHEPCPDRVALLDSVSGAASGSGELALAEELSERAALLRAAVGEPMWLDGALDEARAVHALYRSDPVTALAIARAGLERATSPHGRARLHGTIGCASLEVGDLEAAQTSFEQELECYTEATAWRAVALTNLTDVALRRGDVRRAALLQRSALEIAVEVGHTGTIAYAIGTAARIAADVGDWASAARLAHGALAAQARIGLELFPTERAVIDAVIDEAARHLGHRELEHECTLGGELLPEDAIAHVHSVLDAARMERR